jgi:hypothetical protein
MASSNSDFGMRSDTAPVAFWSNFRAMDVSLPVFSLSDLLAAGITAAFVGILGLWPRLNFAREIGELRCFHGAYDEDTYILS